MDPTQFFLSQLISDAGNSSGGHRRVAIQQDNAFGRSFSVCPLSPQSEPLSPRRGSCTKGRWEDSDESNQNGEPSCCCCISQSLSISQSNTIAAHGVRAQTSTRCTTCPPSPPERQEARKNSRTKAWNRDHRWENATPSLLLGEKGQEAPSLPIRYFE